MDRAKAFVMDRRKISKKTPEKGVFENRKKEDEKFGRERRNFLKFTMYLTGAITTEPLVRRGKEMEKTMGFLEKMLTNFRNRKVRELTNESSEKVELEDETEEGLEDVDQETREENSASLRELVNFDSDKPIALGQAEIEMLKNYWEKRYEGNKKSDLDGALVRMKDWEFPAKNEFLAEGEAYCVQEKIKGEQKIKFLEEFRKCFYLSIPESYWKLGADSGVAAGPFQFTKETASKYKLDRGSNFDERLDPLKSAKAAAKNLLHLYENMNHDWSLVLSGYNGGFVWKFKTEIIEKAKNNPIEISQNLNYLNFLKYLGKKIKELKEELSSTKMLTHKVIKKSETLEEVAIRYGLSEKLLAQMNKMKVGSSLELGSKIIIPPTQDNRRKNFYYHIDGFSQNINYPAKLNAIMAVLEKRAKETGRDPLNQESNLPKWEERRVKQELLYATYVIGRTDSVISLARTLGITEKELRGKKWLFEKNKLKVGAKIEIRNKNKPKTLFSLALANEKKPEIVKLLNPAIKDEKEALPDGAVIRFPVSSFLARK